MDELKPRPTTRSPVWLQRWTVQSLYTLLLGVLAKVTCIIPKKFPLHCFTCPPKCHWFQFSLFLILSLSSSIPYLLFTVTIPTSYQSTHNFYSISHSRRGQSVPLAYYCVILFLYLQDGFKNHVRVLGKWNLSIPRMDEVGLPLVLTNTELVNLFCATSFSPHNLTF